KGSDRRAELTKLIYTVQERDISRERGLQAATTARFGLVGHSAGLVAAPRARLRDAWKAMTVESGAPYSVYGGAWAMERELERGDYLFATWMDMGSLDDWIRLCERAAIGVLHFHAWWDTWGLYNVSTNCFPRGLADMKLAAEKIRAAGIKPGMHTMTCALQFGGPDLTPVCSDDILARRTYTLARPFADGDDAIYVNEPIAADQHKVLTGDSNGNILKLGGELVAYSDFDRTPPYRFTGLTRGWMGTRKNAATYPAGTKVVYPSHRFESFFPRVDTPLAETVASRVANVYNTCGMREIFFDGSEGPREHYTVDGLVAKIYSKLDRTPDRGVWCGMSHSRSYFNWMISHKGAWDYPRFGPKAFMDAHIRVYREQSWKSNLTGMDLGWWNPWQGDADTRGFFEDEMEYACSKAKQIGAVMSYHGFWKTTDRRLDLRTENWMTIAGWWARARAEGRFRRGLCERMSPLGDEWRLRQGADGVWRVAPLFVAKHRAASADYSSWSVDAPEAREAELRVEALHVVDHGGPRRRLLDASDAASLSTAANRGVTVSARPGGRGGIVISAANESARENESWCSVNKVFSGGPVDAGRAGSVWVKGDGSGATLNIHISRTSSIYEGASAEHYLKLDFRGWRRFDYLMRETDSDKAAVFEWPYWDKQASHSPAGLFRTLPVGRTVGAVGYYLNGIRPGTKVEVEVSELEALDEAKTSVEGAAVSVGGKRVVVPFALSSGDYAELRGGVWTKYLPSGEPVGCIRTGDRVFLAKGRNDVSVGATQRLEVTLLAPGRWEEALDGNMSYEAELLGKYAPTEGFDGVVEARVHPGEDARFELRIDGPVKNPSFTVLGQEFAFPVELGEDDRLFVEGGRWRAERVVAGAHDVNRRTKMSARRLLKEGS
ncbi:MAG: hypothetical protein IJQ65_07715, partial [Kiritimatiellae bacterium]|nr:hypothetical protein [Kiritimatiellia bacterium]